MNLLALNVSDLLKMKLEFPKVFTDLLSGAREKMMQILGLKLELIRLAEQEEAKKVQRSGTFVNLQSVLGSHLMAMMMKGMAHTKLNPREKVDPLSQTMMGG